MSTEFHFYPFFSLNNDCIFFTWQVSLIYAYMVDRSMPVLILNIFISFRLRLYCLIELNIEEVIVRLVLSEKLCSIK